MKKGCPEITEPVQREKTGVEPKELVVELHSSGDCCGGGSHETKAGQGGKAVAGQAGKPVAGQAGKADAGQADKSVAEHAGVNPLHADSTTDAPAKGSSCCDKKHGHKHKHSHSHSERRPLPGSTSVFSTVVGDEIVVSAQESMAHQEHHKKVQTTVLLDNLGIAASTLCLIHCMAMPFLIAVLPFLGLQFLEGELAHRVIALFVFAFAIFAIGPGYMQHRKKQVLYATIFGLSLVAGALLVAGPMFGEQYELPFITTGNLILVITHLRNRKLCQCVH